MSRKALVLWNSHAGPGTRERDAGAARLRDALTAAGVEAEVQALHGHELAEAARGAAGSAADVVVAAGGDGTVSTVAAALVGGERPLGVLPLGTLNHFAKDVGLPLGLEEAVRVIATGAARPVDVGEVNGRTFVNNSSLGLYPRIVKERDEQRLHLGRSKWLALLAATFSVFRRFPTVELRLHAEGERLARKTPLLFVGNNRYEISLLSVRGRSCLDRGELCVYVVRSTSRFGLVRLALRSLLRRLDQARDFDALCVSECWIESRRRRLRVAFDGETAVLTPPLHYRSRPGALRVLLPGQES